MRSAACTERSRSTTSLVLSEPLIRGAESLTTRTIGPSGLAGVGGH
jgi:hypothetical protein